MQCVTSTYVNKVCDFIVQMKTAVSDNKAVVAAILFFPIIMKFNIITPSALKYLSIKFGHHTL